MRLVLANPHTHNYGRSVSGFLLRRKDFLKYDYFVEYIVNDPSKDVAFFIDGTRSSFSGIGLASLFSWKFFSWLELVAWMLLNKVNPFRVKVYFSVKKLDTENDILLDFSRSIVDIHDQSQLALNRFKGIVMIHFTHYFKNVVKLSKYLETVEHHIVVAESDLSKNLFFQRYFPGIESVYHLPFAFADRFVSQQSWGVRLNKCLALGSITRVKDKAFVDFFRDVEGLHPMRKIIHEKADVRNGAIDSFIRGFEETSGVRKISEEDNFFTRLMKRFLPFFLLEKFYPTPQITYFKFDIVKKLNEYRMFLCSEESVGLPSINAFEGMAAGAVYFGVDDDMYRGIGLLPNVHYVTYEKDNYGDLLSKIHKYQGQEESLYRIAQSGSQYVRDHFSRRQIATIFWDDLKKVSSEFRATGKICAQSSFRVQAK